MRTQVVGGKGETDWGKISARKEEKGFLTCRKVEMEKKPGKKPSRGWWDFQEKRRYTQSSYNEGQKKGESSADLVTVRTSKGKRGLSRLSVKRESEEKEGGSTPPETSQLKNQKGGGKKKKGLPYRTKNQGRSPSPKAEKTVPAGDFFKESTSSPPVGSQKRKKRGCNKQIPAEKPGENGEIYAHVGEMLEGEQRK